MIRHKTVAFDGHGELLALFGQQLQVHPAITIIKEHILSVITPLGNVMRTTRNDNPRISWHDHSPTKTPLHQQTLRVNRPTLFTLLSVACQFAVCQR